MPYNPQIHHRHTIRLKEYDYTQGGLYFITICVKNRECLFGHIENDEMILNDAGKMVQTEWVKLPERFGNIKLDEFVVMPNHFHGILEIVEADDDINTSVGATLVVAPNAIGDGTADVVNKLVISKEKLQSRTTASGATTRVAPTADNKIIPFLHLISVTSNQ